MTLSVNCSQGPGLWNGVLLHNSLEAARGEEKHSEQRGKLDGMGQCGSLRETHKAGRNEAASHWVVAPADSKAVPRGSFYLQAAHKLLKAAGPTTQRATGL